jgi:hypothetical protein
MKVINGVPLLYVVREIVALPTGVGDDVDHGFGLPTYTQEMIRRAPHTGVLQRSSKESLERYQACDPRRSRLELGTVLCQWTRREKPFLSMKRYYLGESYTRRIKLLAENTLSAAFYNGQVCTLNFGDYVDKLKGAFTDIKSSGEIVDPQCKFRILMQGLSDARLRTGKATVLANPHLYNDFETVVNFFTTVLVRNRTEELREH